MARIFISYKRANKDQVFPIVGKFEDLLGIKCWVDLDGIESSAQFASVICKAIDSFKRAKEYIGDDMIWNGFVCFNLARAEYLKQLLNESLDDKNVGNDWEMYINESIRSWITSNMIIAEHFASKLEKEQVTWLQQALISQENKVRLTKIILQIMKNSSLTDYNGNVWLKSYSKLLKTPFFKGIPEKDPQQLTDSLVKDIEELLESE